MNQQGYRRPSLCDRSPTESNRKKTRTTCKSTENRAISMFSLNSPSPTGELNKALRSPLTLFRIGDKGTSSQPLVTNNPDNTTVRISSEGSVCR